MNAQRKWITRAGALLVVMGFFMPSMLVSCSITPGVGQSVSLQQLADTMNQGVLYIVPFAMTAILIITFIESSELKMQRNLFYAQTGALVLSLVCLILPIFTVLNQVNQYGGFEFVPKIGALVLGGGYILLLIGIFMKDPRAEQMEVMGLTPSQGFEEPQPFYHEAPPVYPAPPVLSIPPVPDSLGQSRSGAWLTGVDWEYEDEDIPLEDQFTIGRATANSLRLADATVSRLHARIRCAQGAWFIQDQQSQDGVYVNGQLTPAARLNEGDRIRIGRATFIFHCNND